jgi:cobaltochelatase CobN
LALLPGDDKPDEELRALSTVADAVTTRSIWSKVGRKFDEFLDLCKGHVGWRRSAVRAAIAEGGVYWPSAGISDLAAARRRLDGWRPVVPIIFYRALVQGGGLNPINRLVKSLLRGMNPYPCLWHR